jgi:triacylglycerol esterase/lipase EstA (alpha/beta hydrolase family)
MVGIGTVNWQAMARETVSIGVAALSLPLRWLAADRPGEMATSDETPIVFVHGFLGDPTNFLVLRNHLEAGGRGSFASFSYPPRLDYQRLAPRLGSMIAGVCAATGARRVDVVGHSIGGLTARYLTEIEERCPIRRLVTLGSPYYGRTLARQELAIFGAEDPLIAAPDPVRGPQRGVVIVPDCGHLGLLYHPTVLGEVASYLGRPAATLTPIPVGQRDAA